MGELFAYPATVILIAANVIASVWAFMNPKFNQNNIFRVGSILEDKEWHRTATSGFIHVGVVHLLLNMYVLYNFGSLIEGGLGAAKFFSIYMISLFGGSFWMLLENRRKPHYTAAGASGAISGLVMCYVLFRPIDPPLYIFPLPFPIPGVILGILFIVVSAILAQREDKIIAHEGHLGGALAGIIATIIVQPVSLSIFSDQIAQALGGG